MCLVAGTLLYATMTCTCWTLVSNTHTHKVSKSGETCNYTSMLALLKCNVFMS